VFRAPAGEPDAGASVPVRVVVGEVLVVLVNDVLVVVGNPTRSEDAEMELEPYILQLSASIR
jgi:hypothetical protein